MVHMTRTSRKCINIIFWPHVCGVLTVLLDTVGEEKQNAMQC